MRIALLLIALAAAFALPCVALGQTTTQPAGTNTTSQTNSAGMAALTQLLIQLTGPENWGVVTVIGPVGPGTEVASPARTPF